MMFKLYTEHFDDNLFQTATTINKLGWADYVIHMHCPDGRYTIVVFKMPAEMVYQIRSDNKSYTGDPHHDDPQ